jgi:D-alanyl-D-alanine carboxypeptidase
MAFVSRYGNTISEDGWRMVDEAECEWITVRGTNVSLEIRKGVPAVILGEFAARFNETVEPLRDPDSACWTATNDVATSNHLAGTAMDLNWDSHPFHVAGTYGDRLPALRALLDEFGGGVWWGGDWSDPIDEMHFQLNWPEGDPRNDELAARLHVAAPMSRQDRYALLIIQEGQRRGISERGIEIALATALVESNLTNYANSNDPASMNKPHDAVGADGMSVGVFQQQNFAEWGTLDCRMDVSCAAGTFYGHLAAFDYNDPDQSPGSFAQAVQRSAFPDRYDERFGEAVDYYHRLAGTALPPVPQPIPTSPGDDMAQVPQAQWDALYHAFMDPVPSRSPLREPGEPTHWTLIDYIRNIDGGVHAMLDVKVQAELGSPDALALLARVAAITDPGRQADAALAATILARIAAHPAAAPVVAPTPIPVAAPVAAAPEASSSTGAHVGQLFDALEALHLSGSLPAEIQAPLAALITVLQSYPKETP